MPLAEVLNLVSLLGGMQADQAQAALYFPQLIADLGRDPIFWQSGFETETLTAGSEVVTLPADLVSLMGAFYNGLELDYLTIDRLKMIDPGWRERTGAVRAFTRDEETASTIGLYPAPDLAQDLTLIRTDNRTGTLPYLDLPMALRILQWEFSRESDHTDVAFAGYCQQLADLMFGVIA